MDRDQEHESTKASRPTDGSPVLAGEEKTLVHGASTELTVIQSEEKQVGEYQLLEEIARGGMGVVYKARHNKLNRTVALKMILAGEFAAPEAINRFYLEAEASAGLDHPGITPIYDIGEFRGLPYFAMRLLTGGSLQTRIHEFESNSQRIAALVCKIAKAVHFAHQHGVLHRDLKPNNILLDDDGEPLITDFGLAKLLDRESSNTQTGAVMGTPGYMAPEQALGGKNITTAADVYSVGAILYRLLTGHATYEAENPLDVVIKSLADEPLAPRKRKPEVPVDLELICLKCLERDPNRRYRSAAEIADDLNRWLEGLPVTVRPASMTTLAGIWMKQNLHMAGGAALVGLACGFLLAALFYLAGYSNNFYYAGQVYEEYFPGLERPWWLPTWQVSPLVFISATFLWPMVIASCGFFAVKLTNPPNRNAAASVGVIAGVFCSGLMAMGGIMGPLISATIEKTETDSRLLTAVATNNLDEQRFAGAAIVRRYPDLSRLDVATRSQGLREKINIDLLFGLVSGVWLGTLVFLTAIPTITVGAMYAWHLKQHSNGWQAWLGRYLDVVLTGCLLLTMGILFYLARPLGAELYVPPHWLRAATIILLGVAVVAAVRRWQWLPRVCIHLLVMLAFSFYVWQSSEAPLAYQRVPGLASAGNLSEAREAVRRSLLVNGSDPWLLLAAGVLGFQEGDHAAYQQHCNAIVDVAYLSNVPEHSDWAVKLGSLSSLTPVSDDELSLLAEKAVTLGKGSQNVNWFYLAAAMANYRIGRDSEALAQVERIDRNYFFVVNCTADVVTAMALQRQGKTAQARETLQAAETWFEDAWDRYLDEDARTSYWLDRLVFETLRTEAAANIR
jgi:tRNA A-37 threonylcarbamoyl transferase component Bud32